MTTNAFQGWILHKRWSGDTSAQVIFFTREHGLLSCLYKGGRTPKKQAVLQPFLPVWLNVNQRREWFNVRHLEANAPPLNLNGDALFSGLYINELIYHVLRPNDAHPELYDAYESSMQALTAVVDRKSIEVILRRFEWFLLKQSGYEMLLTHDIQGHVINEKRNYQFIPGSGFQPAVAGTNGKHILAFASNHFEANETLRAVKGFMRQAINHLLDGRLLKTRSLFVSK